MNIFEIESLSREHTIDELLIFKSWVDGHINDESLLHYYNPIYKSNKENIIEDIIEKVEDTIKSMMNCVTYGKITDESKEELSNTKFYGRVYYLFDDNGNEAYLTQRDLSDTLKSYLGKDKTLRELYNEFYQEYDYLIKDLRIDKALRVALSWYTTYYHIPFKERYKLGEEQLKTKLQELTKDDKEINSSELTEEQIKDSFLISISKFKELYQKQPPELLHIAIDIKRTEANERIEAIENMIDNKDDILFLQKIFKTYKIDKKDRVYNYSLLAFIYYMYELEISIKHIYNSKYLELLGAYEYKKGRKKPTRKSTILSLLEKQQQLKKVSFDENSIYVDSLYEFLSVISANKANYYLVSFLIGLDNNLKSAKDFLEYLQISRAKNLTYKTLPKPTKTLLFSLNQIQNR